MGPRARCSVDVMTLSAACHAATPATVRVGALKKNEIMTSVAETDSGPLCKSLYLVMVP